MFDGELNRDEYAVLRLAYARIRHSAPQEVKGLFPHFNHFISPSNWSLLHWTGRIIYNNYIPLSLTGERRVEMLLGPHARTLLIAWAINRAASAEVS